MVTRALFLQLEDGRPSSRRRAVSWCVTAALVAGLIFSVLVLYGTVLDNRWYKVVAVEGGSMEPTIHRGDAIVVTRPPTRVKPGMIVVLQVERKLVTHRVVAVKPDGTFKTQGDANDYPDDWGSLDVRVVGQYRARVPWLGGGLGHFASGAWANDETTVPVTASSG